MERTVEMASGTAAPYPLRLEQVRKGFHDGTTEHEVLRGLDLTVAGGECVALLGRSGSGKSTLLNVIAGIEAPDAGRIEVLGEDITTLAEPARTLLRRRRIGFVYQFFNLIPTLTVAENVALPLELNPECLSGGEDAPARVREMLARLGLEPRARAYPDQLSGGEQQRVAIGRALIHGPALVLADEPTGNLDADTGRSILSLLDHLAREHGQTLVLVTHSMEVARMADRILTLDDGRLVDSAAELSW